MTRLSSDEPIIIASQPKLDQNIMLFVRLLRRIGLSVGPASMLDAVEATLLVGVHNKSLFYHALASCLIKRPEDQALFEQAFNLFWQNPKFMERVRDLLLPQIKVPGVDIDDQTFTYGCKDTNAINYDSDAFLTDNTICCYEMPTIADNITNNLQAKVNSAFSGSQIDASQITIINSGNAVRKIRCGCTDPFTFRSCWNVTSFIQIWISRTSFLYTTNKGFNVITSIGLSKNKWLGG